MIRALRTHGIDSNDGHLWVGYGGGALGEFDQEGTKLADIKLDAHPESFQLEKNGSRIFVNLPGSRKISFSNHERFNGLFAIGYRIDSKRRHVHSLRRSDGELSNGLQDPLEQRA